MGCCTESIISWGFSIPQEKFPALLKAFRAHDQLRSGDPDPNISTYRSWDRDVAELSEYINAVLKQGGYKGYFHFIMSGMTEDGVGRDKLSATFLYYGEYVDGGISVGYTVSRWGRENYGGTCSALPVLNKDVITGDADTMEKLEKFKKDMFLEEAGVEVQEQWVQTVQIT